MKDDRPPGSLLTSIDGRSTGASGQRWPSGRGATGTTLTPFKPPIA